METSSISVALNNKRLSINHNNRIFIAKNVDASKIKDNIIYKQENIIEAYNKLFSKALNEYNKKQKQPCRRINNYFEKIKNGKQEKLFREVIIQFGDMKDTPVGSERGEIAKQMLDMYMKEFYKRNPNFYVFNAVMHLDESTPHLHIDFIPIAYNQKRGLSTRNSFEQALEQQGFYSHSRKNTAVEQFIISEKSYLKEILKKHKIDFINKNVNHPHLEIEEYKEYQYELDKVKQELKILKQKPENELSNDEIKMIKNENSILFKENEKLKSRQSIIRKDFYFNNEDVLSFITEKLQTEGIDATIEGEAIRAPEWAEERIKELEKIYKPKPTPWREQVKFDIDRLIYAVKSIDELWESLRNKGYEIKIGKYISVKPKGAERFIRTKSLGYEYSFESLERRIANNRSFEKGCVEKINTTSGIEKEFHLTVRKVVVLFYKQSKYPKKINKNKPFTFKNDYHITELKNCLDLIKTENIKSDVDLQNKRERCDQKIIEAKEKIKEINDLQDAIKNLRDKANLYFNSRNSGKMNSMQEMKIAVAKETLDDYGVKNESDLLKVDEAFENNKKEIETHLKTIQSENEKLTKLLKLSEIYEQTQSGGYISNLVKMERERISAEREKHSRIGKTL